ncbi:MAG: murein hydrolase activator EnvC family protein [Solirubrobacterales bacterium]
MIKAAIIAVLLASLALAGLTASSPAQDLRGQVDQKKSALDQAKGKQGVLSTEIAAANKKISKLTTQVASLRNREAQVQAELEQAEQELVTEQENLEILRERLARSVKTLEKRLVAIYKADSPDAVTVLLKSDGFDEILSQYEYLERIESQDADIVGRTRDLRDDTRETVDRIRATRDAIAAKKAELERNRANLEAREAALAAAQSRNQATLARVDSSVKRLEGDIRGLESKIQAQIAAAQAEAEAAAAAAASASSSSSSSGGASAPLPAGPIKGGSGDMIWPVNGPLTSPFGFRWGRLHAGIDISAAGGTPIRAAKAGTIAVVQSEAESGGYGNYTCIAHGASLSTCYAHQSSFAKTSGNVSQGDVIGYVGNTGNSFGDHLHFEVRVGGSPVDPLGYL